MRGWHSSHIQSLLTDVQSVHSNTCAFAAVKADGSVVTWGDEDWGGDSSNVQHLLTDVLSVCPSLRAFAALKADDSVVTWGVVDPCERPELVESDYSTGVITPVESD